MDSKEMKISPKNLMLQEGKGTRQKGNLSLRKRFPSLSNLPDYIQWVRPKSRQ